MRHTNSLYNAQSSSTTSTPQILNVPRYLHNETVFRGRLKRSARAVQLFGRLAVVETHTLWYFGHHCCLVVGFDAFRICHFWMFTLFTHFYFFAHIFSIYSFSWLIDMVIHFQGACYKTSTSLLISQAHFLHESQYWG